MHAKSLLSFVFVSVALTLLVLLMFVTLSWMNVPTGRFLDWVVGLLCFWWLLVIATVPWNMYFQAKEVLADAAMSKAKAIPVKAEDVAYVAHLAKRSFMIAVILHVVSALALYLLAAFGVSRVGYVASGMALLLTGLRPAIRAYEYVYRRLIAIRQEIKYPREDVLELRRRVITLEETVKALKYQMTPEKPDSWVTTQHQHLQATQDELTRVRLALEAVRLKNQTDHEHLAREAERAIAQMTRDGEFLDHVREIIQFIKSALSNKDR